MLKTELVAKNEWFAQTKGNIVSSMGQEKVMLSVQKGKYYNLGSIGGRVWDLIQTPATFVQITDALMREYEVEQNQCDEQVWNFLQLLIKEGLIQTGSHDEYFQQD